MSSNGHGFSEGRVREYFGDIGSTCEQTDTGTVRYTQERPKSKRSWELLTPTIRDRFLRA